MKQLLSLIILGLSYCILSAQPEQNFEYYHGNGGYENATLNPVSALKKTKLYSKADTNSKHTALMPATTLYIQEMGEAQGCYWYYVNTDANIKGYVKYEDVIPFRAYNFATNSEYYIWKDIEGDHWADPTFVIKAKKDNPSQNDTLVITDMPYYLRVTDIYYKLALKNINKLIDLEFYNAQCPGTSINVFVGDCGDSLTVIESSFSSGEQTWYDSRIVYLPFKFDNGKILLVANADVTNIFNHQTAELNVFPYPADCGISIEELIVIVNESGEEEEIIENTEEASEHETHDVEPAIDKEPVLKVQRSVEYYRWDGYKAVKVK